MNWLKNIFSKTAPPELPAHFHENAELSEEQISRKLRSEECLFNQGIAINPHLPCIESESEAAIRDPLEVQRRFFAVSFVASVAWEKQHGDMPHDALHESCNREIDKRDRWSWFTDQEQRYLKMASTDPNEDLQLSWRYEAAWPLYWALGSGPEKLEEPVSECDVGLLAETAHTGDPTNDPRLRATSVILDEADLIYRYHWATRQANLSGRELNGISSSVVIERHHALNWLIGYEDQDWDEVTTDT
ncbi:DUF4272 domain-containing protein [Qipengyuania sp. DGS5-3]|uniref:DUF4272 domain-containing protein n=1 Tax=Qipengyuania sp. DGS5-3 TaxID=3349632 RepID=UPI0036D37215